MTAIRDGAMVREDGNLAGQPDAPAIVRPLVRRRIRVERVHAVLRKVLLHVSGKHNFQSSTVSRVS